MPEYICKICNKQFAARTTGKFCSVECKKKNKSSLNSVFHEKNKNKVNEKARERYQSNLEYYRERDKQKREVIKQERINSGAIVRKRTNTSHLSEDEKVALQRKKENERKRIRYQEDEVYMLRNRIRALTNKSIKKSGFSKDSTTEEYLGCDYETFKIHIESRFKEGMSWENRNEWHIDHIIPISSAKTPEEVKKLSNYKNLHPMWANDNLKKSNRLGFSNIKGIMIKNYEERGDYEQFRNEKIVNFKCMVCGAEKTSKLVVVYKGDWQKIICNGCYGKVLSNVKQN